jgi:hypothetical protein
LKRARYALSAFAALMLAPLAQAQTPGEWRYTIATDQAKVPADMRVNFPTITFSACRSAEDFSSGRAFALQTLASSSARCPSAGYVRAPLPGGRGESMRFVYACDEGKTLSGLAQGRVFASSFSVELESRYSPPVSGVEIIRQTMTGTRVGACKVAPDADLLKVE